MTKIEMINIMTEEFINLPIPIFINSNKEKVGLESIGTGFIVNFKETLYFITAKHVIDVITNENLAMIIINNNLTLDLKKHLKFDYYLGDDIAISHLCQNFLLKKGLKNIARINLDINMSKCESTIDTALLIGYPSTKNILSSRYDKVDKFVSGIGLYERKVNYLSNTKLNNPIVFSYNLKNIYESSGKNKINPHKLNGMSGSPILQLHINDASFEIKLIGVFLEWHKSHHEVIGTSLDGLLNIINNYHEKYKGLYNYC